MEKYFENEFFGNPITIKTVVDRVEELIPCYPQIFKSIRVQAIEDNGFDIVFEEFERDRYSFTRETNKLEQMELDCITSFHSILRQLGYKMRPVYPKRPLHITVFEVIKIDERF